MQLLQTYIQDLITASLEGMDLCLMHFMHIKLYKYIMEKKLSKKMEDLLNQHSNTEEGDETATRILHGTFFFFWYCQIANNILTTAAGKWGEKK